MACICELVRPVDNRTRVVIVQHPKETRHPFGTARIAKLGLRNFKLIVAQRDGDGVITSDDPKLEGAALLYPGPDSTLISELTAPVRSLVVVDGTWPMSRKLLRETPWMGALPRVALAPPRPGNYRIRKAKRPEVQISTVEAIAFALHELEPDTPGVMGLLDDFDAMIDHLISLRGGRRRPRFHAKRMARSQAQEDGVAPPDPVQKPDST